MLVFYNVFQWFQDHRYLLHDDPPCETEDSWKRMRSQGGTFVLPRFFNGFPWIIDQETGIASRAKTHRIFRRPSQLGEKLDFTKVFQWFQEHRYLAQLRCEWACMADHVFDKVLHGFAAFL